MAENIKQKQIGNYLFNMDLNIGENPISQALLALVAGDCLFTPDYSFTCNYLEPIQGAVSNQITIPHVADCRYYIGIVFNMNQPSIDVDQCVSKIESIDQKISYVIKNKWIMNQDVYCLYEASQISDYLSRLALSIQFNETEYQKFAINKGETPFEPLQTTQIYKRGSKGVSPLFHRCFLTNNHLVLLSHSTIYRKSTIAN